MHELLAPVGDIESLYQAIHNGADAVYLGMKSFGARKFSKNFNNEEVVDAIKYSHLYGVKVYVTMNTLVKNNEVKDFLDQVGFLYKNGVDAIIMQDFGMINLVRRIYPELDIHASTQSNQSSIDTIKLFHDIGVKRVVLSRELTLEEIEKINIPIEKEVFIHGALCISYSGNCLMSSMIGGRSGNRGECAGSCRLKYSLEKNGEVVEKNKYLLSTKEFNTSNKFKELLNSNITSFKIEGRMKSAEYVGFVTRLYRNLIDGKSIDLEEENNKLKTLFNRKFTTGNLFNDNNLMNIDTPNHIGLEIGRVIDITNNKIKIKLNRELNQEDGIRFLESGKGFIVNYLYDKNNKLISNSKDIVYLDNKVNLKTKDRVFKTYDKKLNTNLKNYIEKKINITFNVTAKKNKSLVVVISDDTNKIELTANVVEEAISSPISKEQIKRQFMKLGNTPFICKNINIDMDNDIYINIKDINIIRRKAVQLLIEKRSNKKIDVVKKDVFFDNISTTDKAKLVCSIKTEEQLKICLELDFDRIYVNDINLYNKYKDKKCVIYSVARNKFVIEEELKEKNMVSEYLNFNNKNIYGNYSLNVYNIYTAYYLNKLGLLNIPISVELTEEEIEEFYDLYKEKFNTYPLLEILVYGRVENMIIKGNVLKLKEGIYNLIDQKNNKFKAFYKDGLTHVLDSNIRGIYLPSDKYIKRFDFVEEDRKIIKDIVNKYK